MKQITIKMLTDKKACPQQVALFRKHFPKGVRPTQRQAKKYAHVFDFDWAARNLLSYTARKAYNEATAPALKAYNEATAPALKAYEEAKAPAWKAYKEATATACKAYKEATAPAFVKAFNLYDE